VSTHDPRIRPARPGDAAQLAALAGRVFVATYGSAIPALTLQEYLRERFTPASFSTQIAADTLLVAVVAGQLAGYARLDRAPAPACVGESGAVELAQLYVEASQQGRGLGAALLAAACDAAGAPIWLCAWERNQRALRFYARHGFVPVGEIKVYVGDVVFDDLVLVRLPVGDKETRRQGDKETR
jgi:ribosomal protein S18 acetylase RimI-like enzyme